jgi:hypothetical protein
MFQQPPRRLRRRPPVTGFGSPLPERPLGSSVPEALSGALPGTLPETLLGRLPETLATGEGGAALLGLPAALLFADALGLLGSGVALVDLVFPVDVATPMITLFLSARIYTPF